MIYTVTEAHFDEGHKKLAYEENHVIMIDGLGEYKYCDMYQGHSGALESAKKELI